MANTKRALLTSALAIVACVAMLIGSTFAWFTDTASTGVNKIQAGNLKVDLQIFDKETGKWVTAEGKTLDFVKAEGHGNEEVLWEPGVRYALPELRIVNKGNLALKYRVVIAGAKDATPDNGIDDLKLLDVIDWTYSVSGAGGDAVASLDTERHLAAKTGDEDVYDTLKIMGTMQTTAGNDYQGMAVEGIAIKVYATQDTVESDSFDDQYDAKATYYPVLDQAGLKDALAAGGNVKVDKDVAVAPELTEEQKNESSLAPQTTVTKDTVLDLSGKKIGVEAKEDFGKASPVLMTVMDGTLTINGDGEINCEAGNQQVYGINVYGGHVVINGGSFYGAITAVQVQKGTLTINGGFFDMAPTCKTAVPQYAKYVVNCIDAAYKNGTAKIAICGGTFVNFDPSADPEGAGTSYVADGYVVVAEKQANGDTWYTVVKKVTYATIAEAFPDADFGYGSTVTEPVVLDGKGAVTVSGWTDAWVNADTTVKGVTFKNGAVFSTKADNVTVTLEDCTFYACDQSKLTYTGNNSLTNSGAGMCLNLEKSARTGVKFIVKNCTFIGENDKTLSAEGPRYNGDGTQNGTKKRGHAIAIDAICGGGTGTLDSVLIEGCTIDGVRGNAIQLYGKTGAITIKDTKINSWAVNKDGIGYAIRGDFDANGSRTLTIENVYFGLDEIADNTEFGHVKVGSFSGNTDGTEVAGTYSK